MAMPMVVQEEKVISKEKPASTLEYSLQVEDCKNLLVHGSFIRLKLCLIKIIGHWWRWYRINWALLS